MRGQLFVIVEGGAVGSARAELVAAGWSLVEGWDALARGVVCIAELDGPDAAQHAVLAAVAGAGLLLTATASREVLDMLYDDLRRFGPLDHRFGDASQQTSLTPEERALLQLLLTGVALGEAAQSLHLSRRTADRRLASARRALGVASTAEALVRASIPRVAPG